MVVGNSKLITGSNSSCGGRKDILRSLVTYEKAFDSYTLSVEKKSVKNLQGSTNYFQAMNADVRHEIVCCTRTYSRKKISVRHQATIKQQNSIKTNSIKSLSCTCHVILGGLLTPQISISHGRNLRGKYISVFCFEKSCRLITKTNKFTPRLTGDFACIMFFKG